MGRTDEPAEQAHATEEPRHGTWAVRPAAGVAAAGWAVLLALCLWGALPSATTALMVLVALWHGYAFGRVAGACAAAACVALGVLAAPALGTADAAALAVALLVAAAGGSRVRLRGQCVRERLEATRAGLAALQGSQQQARRRLAALRTRLGQAERLATVGTMSAQIAHQLRNPLTSIGLYVQLVEDELRELEPGDAAEAFELLDRVLHELKVLVEITDNYLQYARLPELEAARLDVNPAVGELVRFLRHEVERKGITVSARLGEGLAPVEADRRLLRFALMNLLKNAIEAMGPGGRLRVLTAQQDGKVEIHVSDTGPGIAPEELPQVFEPFYTTKDSGSGLGLSLSRQIIDKHDGTLTCQSMVGVGTTFIVSLPARAGDRRTSDGSTQAPDSAHRG